MGEKVALTKEQRRKLLLMGRNKQPETVIEALPRQAGDQVYPVSSSQRRVWFLYQMKHESIEYNVPVAFYLYQKMDLEACQKALDAIVARHEVLRTTFCEQDGEPAALVHASTKAWLEYEDYRNMPDTSAKDQAVDERIKQVTNGYFDLEKGPLFKTILVQKEEEIYILAMVAHHSVIDSWSLDLLKKEFEQLYLHETQGTELNLPELPIQYVDYAAWQQKQLDGENGSRKLQYWVKKLKDSIPVLNLPTDYERPPVRSAEGRNYFFRLDEVRTKQLKEATVRNGCTSFMYLMAVFQILLFHYTQERRITVGTTISDRPTKETEHLLGFFINNITYNTEVIDGICFTDYLAQVKKETLEMYQNQAVPFERVVEQLHVQRDLSRTAVFQVMFNYLSAAGNVDQIEGLKSDYYSLGGSKASTDLNLFSWEEEKTIAFNMEYAKDLFCEDSIVRFSQHYLNLIDTFLKKPEQPIEQAEFLSEEEKKKLLDEEIQTIPKVNLDYMAYKRFERQVELTPHNRAMYFEGKEMDYEMLNKKANQIAHYLMEQGAVIGERIGLYMDRSMEMIIGMLAVQKAGGVYVPLDPTYPSERIEKIMRQAETKKVLTQRYLLANVPLCEDTELICMDQLLQEEKPEWESNPNLSISGQDLMYILFTSGSTGEPKGVMIQHQNYASYFESVMERVGITEPLQYIVVTTFAADLGSFCIYAPLLTGGCVHIVAYERATDAQWLSEYFQNHAIDVMKMVPSHFEALQSVDNARFIIPRKMIIFAGEAVMKETIEKVWSYNPECKVWNKYGPSETTVTATAYEIKREEIDKLSEIPLGKPLVNTYGYVLNPWMKPVPYGVIGELYLGGEGVSAGYLGREDLTRERYLPDPFHPDCGYRIYKTGDLVRRKADGNLMFVGRADRQVKIRGYRIELGAIEKVLREVYEVEEAVVDVRKEGDHAFLCAYVTLNTEDETVNATYLRKTIKSKIPDYWMPSFFLILKELPLNANGKIDYKALPMPSLSGQLEESYVAPRNETEQQLAQIWSETLGIEKIGIDDNFFDLGGESFKAVKMIRKIGQGISVIDLFKFPTIRELYQRISGQVATEEGRLVRLTPKPTGKVRMNYICFPFAGGSAVAFQPLANELPDQCQLFGVRLPGHDFSTPDDVGGTMDSLITECVAEIKEKVEGPISIYAQCVAGAVGIALAYALEAEGILVHTVFEAANFPSPRLPGRLAEWWSKIFPSDRWMSNRVYRETLKSLGNSDETNNAEEEDFMIAGIRHDARMAEDYFSSNYYKKDLVKLKAPICCIFGDRDRTTEFYEERYHEWERYSDNVSYEVIPDAGHFFHKHQPKEVWGILAQQLVSRKAPQEKVVAAQVAATTEASNFKKNMSMKLFFFIIFGQIVSILGSNISGFAVGIWLYGDTGSIGNFSLVSVATLVPSILLAPIAGMVADRYDKRKIMILGDLFAIIGTFMMFVLYSTGQLQVWHVCIAVVISAIGGAFQRPAFLSAIPVLVPKCYLGQANGILQFITSGGQMLGPILGASALYAFGMKGVLLLDFITCFVSVGTLSVVRFPERVFKRREEPFKKELIGGWNYIIKRHSMVVMVAYFVVANFLMSLVTVIFTPLAIGVAPESQRGLVLSMNAAGVVVGSIIMSLWGGTKRRATGMVGFLLLTSTSMIVMGARPSAFLVGLGLFFFGMSIAFVDTHWQIMIQSKVGLELQGRVFSINEMVVSIFRPFAYLLAPVFCDKLFTPFMEGSSGLRDVAAQVIGSDHTRGIGLFLIVVGVILLLWGIFGMNYRPLRYMEDYLPDAIPGAVIYKDKDKIQEAMDLAMKGGAQ